MTEPYIPQTPPTPEEIYEAEKDHLAPVKTRAEAELEAAAMEQQLKQGGSNE